MLLALFEKLESTDAESNGETLAARHGVRSYGLAMTTLEQVFLRLGVCSGPNAQFSIYKTSFDTLDSR